MFMKIWNIDKCVVNFEESKYSKDLIEKKLVSLSKNNQFSINSRLG